MLKCPTFLIINNNNRPPSFSLSILFSLLLFFCFPISDFFGILLSLHHLFLPIRLSFLYIFFSCLLYFFFNFLVLYHPCFSTTLSISPIFPVYLLSNSIFFNLLIQRIFYFSFPPCIYSIYSAEKEVICRTCIFFLKLQLLPRNSYGRR